MKKKQLNLPPPTLILIYIILAITSFITALLPESNTLVYIALLLGCTALIKVLIYYIKIFKAMIDLYNDNYIMNKIIKDKLNNNYNNDIKID